MAATISGFYGTVSESAEANRFHRLHPPLVKGTADLAPTSTGTRTIRMAAGTAIAAGVIYTETATKDVALPSNTSGNPRIDIVGLRFTWNGASSTVTTFSRQGTAAASPVPPSTLVRNPGVTYELPIAAVYVRSGITTIAAADVYDLRVIGGRGGRFVMIDSKLTNQTYLNLVDLPHGSHVLVDNQWLYQVWSVAANGYITTNLVGNTNKWKAHVPVLRDGYGTEVTYPPLTFKNARYRVKNGYCHYKVELRMGGTPRNFGGGGFLLDLPVRIGTKMTDQWSEAFLRTEVGDGQYEWPCKVLMRSGETRARLYAPTRGDDARLLPMASNDTVLNLGYIHGIPIILPQGTYTEPARIIADIHYLVD